MRISDAVPGLLKKEEDKIMDVRRVCTMLCAMQLQRRGNFLSLRGLGSEDGAVALRRNCVESFCKRYESSGCKSLYGDYDGSGMERAKGSSEAYRY